MFNSIKVKIMKKVLLVLALVVAYGVSMSNASPKVVTIDETQVTVVADLDDDKTATPEGEKEEGKKGKVAKSDGCGGTKAKADSGCATAKSKDCGGDEKSATASKGCGDKK